MLYYVEDYGHAIAVALDSWPSIEFVKKKVVKSKKWQQYEDKDAKAREVDRRLFDVKPGACAGCGTIVNRCSCDTENNINRRREWLMTEVDKDP